MLNETEKSFSNDKIYTGLSNERLNNMIQTFTYRHSVQNYCDLINYFHYAYCIYFNCILFKIFKYF